MMVLFLKVLLMASFMSFGKENNVEPDRLFIKLIPQQRFVKVNDTLSVSLYIENNENFHLEYEWEVERGKMISLENKILFIAPASKGDISIKVRIRDQFGKVYKDSVLVKVYKQFIILKADDLVNDHEFIFPQRWRRYIDYIEKRQIKTSIGIIGNSLAYGNQNYFNLIKEYHDKGKIEFWNHGFDHIINGYNDSGEPCHEFKNSSLDYQKLQIQKAQNLSKSKLGFYFRTFGAPGNGIDSNTLRAIESDSTLKVWFYGDPASTRLNLGRHPACEIEYPVHNPNYKRFIDHYDPSANLLVLQVHPNSWDYNRFDEFYKIIDHLISKGVSFINPFEYYLLINDAAEEIMF